MHIEFDPASRVDWKAVFDRPPQSGSGGVRYAPNYYRDYPTGAGLGNIFGRIIKFLLPVATSAARTVGKSVGREALQTGSRILGDIADNPSAAKEIIKKTRTGGHSKGERQDAGNTTQHRAGQDDG
jgi:hypothetical protein